MKSIRLSLVVYFLALSGAALGAVSWFVYESSNHALQDSAGSKQRLLRTQFDQRVKEVGAALDHRVLSRAQYLSRFIRWSHEHYEALFPLGVLGAALQPQGHLATPLWVWEGNHRGLAFTLFKTIPVDITVESAEDVAPHAEDYYQITRSTGEPADWSESLGDDRLPLTERARDPDVLLNQARFKDVLLSSGVKVRLVTLRTKPRFRQAVLPQMPWGFGRGSGKPPPPERPPDRPGRGGGDKFFGRGPSVYLQYAIATSERDATVAGYRAELESNLAHLATESDETLARLRQRLLWVSLATFVALAVGGFYLVRLGLAPLQRLSEAVSRVSEKDFCLQVDDTRLPRELQPIVDRLKQALDLLRRAFGREKQAAADISHELRTPLAALLTTLDVGLRKPRTEDEYRELLEDCRAAGRQITHLVERLLALARLDAGVDHLRPCDVDAAVLAAECAAMVRPLAEARDIRVRVHVNGPVPLRTDPDKLREILTNLLHNAIQYNHSEGSIDVSVARHNGTVNVEVHDTGVGIAPDVKDQIFERFYRADPSRNADGGHAGLGLAIVKGYVDLMGGTIAVDSAVGEGSTFRIRLPAGQERMAG
jgi:two-component system, OmpR family, heavy metal sensor histidine kinase CusS